MKYRLSLCDADRERYGGPEWLEFNDVTIDEATADVLERYEAELLPQGVSLVEALTEWRRNLSARSVRVVLWLALHQAGVVVKYKDFNPKVLVARFLFDDPDAEDAAGDADPPALGEDSSRPSSEPAATGGSEPSPGS